MFCEKPLGVSLDSARRMVEAVDRAGVTNQVGLILRRSPVFHLLKQLGEEPCERRTHHRDLPRRPVPAGTGPLREYLASRSDIGRCRRVDRTLDPRCRPPRMDVRTDHLGFGFDSFRERDRRHRGLRGRPLPVPVRAPRHTQLGLARPAGAAVQSTGRGVRHRTVGPTHRRMVRRGSLDHRAAPTARSTAAAAAPSSLRCTIRWRERTRTVRSSDRCATASRPIRRWPMHFGPTRWSTRPTGRRPPAGPSSTCEAVVEPHRAGRLCVLDRNPERMRP